MEIHHHTHTPRKKWTHYLWEFLMLFLAVSLGFFVENQREHYIEHKREKDYVRLFIQDLKADTFLFNHALNANKENQLWMDSLLYLLKTYKNGDSTDELYYLARNIPPKGISTQYSNRTFDQLKGSGGFRLIRNTKVLDSLTLYYESLKELDIMVGLRLERFSNFITASEELFDGWAMNSIFESDLETSEHTPPLLTTDRIVWNRYVTRLGFFKAVDRRIIERVEQGFLPNAINLIGLIEREYHLD